MARLGKGVVDLLLMLVERFSLALRLSLSRLSDIEGGREGEVSGSLHGKFQGEREGEVVHQRLLASEN